MAMTDPLGDMLTRIRNGAARRKSSVSTPASKLRARVLDVLQAEGYIRGYSEVEFDNGKAELNIELKYYEGASVIRKIDRVSKPGRRVYVSVKSIPQVANGLEDLPEEVSVVLVHDAARPLISESMIDRVVVEARAGRGAGAAGRAVERRGRPGRARSGRAPG